MKIKYVSGDWSNMTVPAAAERINAKRECNVGIISTEITHILRTLPVRFRILATFCCFCSVFWRCSVRRVYGQNKIGVFLKSIFFIVNSPSCLFLCFCLFGF